MAVEDVLTRGVAIDDAVSPEQNLDNPLAAARPDAVDGVFGKLLHQLGGERRVLGRDSRRVGGGRTRRRRHGRGAHRPRRRGGGGGAPPDEGAGGGAPPGPVGGAAPLRCGARPIAATAIAAKVTASL